MKRIFIVALIMIMICNVSCVTFVNATESDDDIEYIWDSSGDNHNFNIQLERLHHYGVIPKSFGVDPDILVTRRMALHTIYMIWDIAGTDLTSPAKYQGECIDVEECSTDAVLVECAMNYIFMGKINENGERYADLDSEVTLAEVLTMLLRMLGCTYVDTDELIKKTTEENKLSFSEGVYLLAEDVGLVDYRRKSNSRINDFPGYYLDILEKPQGYYLDILNAPITFREFVALCNRSLYIPVWYGWHTEDPTYYINILETYGNHSND